MSSSTTRSCNKATQEVVRFEKGDDLTNPANVGTENGWHTDVTWRVEPAMGAVLRAVEVPSAAATRCSPTWGARTTTFRPSCASASTMFARALVRARVRLRHVEESARMLEQYPPVEHPVVRTHPETGRKTLFVNSFFTERIVGVDDAESEWLLDRLALQAMHPEWQVRLHWEPGTVAMWDNRATQHYASSDYYPGGA